MDAPQVIQAGEVRSSRIESLRALAALAVLEGHVWGYAHNWDPYALYGSFARRTILGGGSGVFIFFALSGYLLFWPFAKQHFGGGTKIDLRRYALNRVLRILPLYYVAVVTLMLVAEHGGHPGQWWRFGLFAWTFSTSTLGTVDGPLWSVVVEIHFYALLPLFALGLAFLTRRRWGAAVVALLLIAAAGYGFSQWALARDPHTAQLVRYSLPGTFYFFVPGMLVAMLRLRWDRWSARLPAVLRSTVVWLAAAVPFWAIHFDRGYAGWAAAAGSFLLVGACVLPLSHPGVLRPLEWRPLALAGIASYSIYVWHMPIVHGLSNATGWSYPPLLLLSLAVMLPVAFLSYRFIERPFLALRRRWTPAAPPQHTATDPVLATL
jgi:peptidoglycan/LPS O-acetylase OafA/YrhL